MNIQQIVKILTDAGIEKNEAIKEIEVLLEFFCNYTAMDKIRGKALTEEQFELIKEKALQIASDRTPVQYITGEAWFMGNKFKVTPDVLIPRDETEISVREAINLIKENGLKSVLDIGTGSGCIACTIAKHTDATVLGIDISSNALRIALDNVTKLGINNRAIFRKSDLFEKIREEEKFDLIISNPPYIPYGTDLQPEVLHEPASALFANEDGLEFYQKIIRSAPLYLNHGGYIVFELGINQADKVKEFMGDEFTDIRIIKDLAGIERVICGKLKE